MLMNEYVYCGGKFLRCGYTTGSCAAAAAKAASEMLLSGKKISSIRLMTPKGIELELDLLDIVISEDKVSCAVRKDSGDDPDITNGILIYAKAERVDSGIEISGGEGIGTVTRNGLDQPKGSAAINSIPRKNITDAVSNIMKHYNYKGGVKITLSVPEGKELAEKTYNPRMGIEGGISIIGTTGIVEPMSTSAIIETIRMEERVRRSEGYKSLLLTIGNYSESFLQNHLPDISEKSVKCSNYIGNALDAAVEYGFENVLIVGHIGKLVKLGAGIMNTHSSQADGRMDVLVTSGLLAGADLSVLRRIPDCVTVDEALAILSDAGCLKETSEILMKRAQFYLDAKVNKRLKIGAVMFSNKFGIIGMTETAGELWKDILEEYNG
ncbi:MAG: cobalt-precorrin-5B (C(1))-methyltransferase CbiD [Oscillospiraceae bacterium]|nr:cobalt-precorrin-5B (C(1))-methyltransferase CbiD [Oscillospiraceae bacterium]